MAPKRASRRSGTEQVQAEAVVVSAVSAAEDAALLAPLTATLPSSATSLSDCPVLFTLPLPSDCTLPSIVCSYGFFRLPPNTWIPHNTAIANLNLTIQPTAASSSSSSSSSPPPTSVGCQLHELPPIAHGCFIRSLRFGHHDCDAVFIAITQETVPNAFSSLSTASTTASATSPLSSSASPLLLTYHLDQQLVIRAIQPPHSALSTATPLTFSLSSSDLLSLQSQVCRMLRLHPSPVPHSQPNPYAPFYALKPQAQLRGFARLFHSPTTFEDCMKTITLCNVNWKGTILMNATLSTLIGLGQHYQLRIDTRSQPWQAGAAGAARQASTTSVMASVMGGAEPVASLDDSGGLRVEHSLTLGVFPSPWELASVDDGELRRLCRVGYRSQRIIRLGHRFAHEGLEEAIHALLEPASPTSSLYSFLLSLDGFGPFAAANATALLGRYDAHPFDSETVRHMREHHGVDRQFKHSSAELLKRARLHYTKDRFGDHIFLVYWFELWEGYESRAACRAEQWTQTQFAGFSNGGKALQKVANNGSSSPSSPPHSVLVAQQTRRRKQEGGGGQSPKRRVRRSHLPQLSADVDLPEEQPVGAADVDGSSSAATASEGPKAKEGKAKGKGSGRITGMLRAVKPTSIRAARAVRGKVDTAAAAVDSPRRLTRAAARRAEEQPSEEAAVRG